MLKMTKERMVGLLIMVSLVCMLAFYLGTTAESIGTKVLVDIKVSKYVPAAVTVEHLKSANESTVVTIPAPVKPTEVEAEILFTPVTELNKELEAQCLSLVMWAEERNGSEEDWLNIGFSVINRAMDPRDSFIYKSSICGVILTKAQYTPMVPYFKDIRRLIRGEIAEFAPAGKSSKNSIDYLAWVAIRKMGVDMMNGAYPNPTVANHFFNIRGVRQIPMHAKSFRIVGFTSSHILLVDYHTVDDVRVYYTKDRPYVKLSHLTERRAEKYNDMAVNPRNVR